VTPEQLASLGPLAPGPLAEALLSRNWVSSEELASLEPQARTTLRFDRVISLEGAGAPPVEEATHWGERPETTGDPLCETGWGDASASVVGGASAPAVDETGWGDASAPAAAPALADDKTVWGEGAPPAAAPAPANDNQTAWDEGPSSSAAGSPASGSGVPLGRDPARFVGHYELLEELGQGAMGTVHRALDTQLGRHVAIKRITPGISGVVLRERFRREGELAARLSHPGIIRVHDLGDSGGAGYLVCELVEGAQDFLSGVAGESLEGQVASLRDAALALGFAHERGIIHRDVKPDNLLVGADRRVRVADFGLAAAIDLERLTQTGVLLGTPAYMAPEQVLGSRELGPPVDVWALGVVLYEILTGQRPFVGEGLQDLFLLIQAANPTRPRALEARAWPSLEAVCLKALSAEAGDRYADASAMAKDLDRALKGEATLASSDRQRPAWIRFVPWVLILAVAGVLAGIVIALGPSSPEPRAPSSATPLSQPPGPEFKRLSDQLRIVSGIGQRLNLLHLKPDGVLRLNSQSKPNGAFSNWSTLDAKVDGFTAFPGEDERLKLFWISREDGAVYHTSQNLIGGWAGEVRKVVDSARSLALFQDFHGRLVLVAGGEEATVFQRQGVVNGTFTVSSEAPIGGVDLVCGERSSDQRLEFAMVIKGVVLRSHQETANDLDTLVAPCESGIEGAKQIAMIRRPDGVLELFALTEEGDLLRTHQLEQAEHTWGKPETIAVSVGQFAVTRAPGRRLALFVSDREGWISEYWQRTDGGFGGGTRVPEARGSSVTAAQREDGSVVLAWINPNGEVDRARASNPGGWTRR